MSGLRVALAGDEAAGVRTLGMLQRSVHEVVLVAANPSDLKRSLSARALASGVSVIDARRLRCPDVCDAIATERPDVLLNVHSLHKVHDAALDAFGVGAWNLHPGPLPEAAGINVPSWAIAQGHAEHGVTVHAMTATYDGGAIAYEDRFPIAADDTGLTLSARCANRGLVLVQRLIEQLASDPAGVPRRPQELAGRRFYGTGQPNGGFVSWTDSADAIAAHVRAADFRPFDGPWDPPRAVVNGSTMALLDVAVEGPTSAPPGTVRFDGTFPSIASGDRWVRVLDSQETTDHEAEVRR